MAGADLKGSDDEKNDAPTELRDAVVWATTDMVLGDGATLKLVRKASRVPEQLRACSQDVGACASRTGSAMLEQGTHLVAATGRHLRDCVLSPLACSVHLAEHAVGGFQTGVQVVRRWAHETAERSRARQCRTTGECDTLVAGVDVAREGAAEALAKARDVGAWATTKVTSLWAPSDAARDEST